MRIEQLTFTRFIAALSIVVFHFGADIFPFNYNCFSFLIKQANLGVSYFFILSGFVMIIAYGQNGKRVDKFKYYMNRLARIYPIYLAALLLMVIFYFADKRAVSPTEFVLSFFVVQAWIPPYPLTLNGPGWSLAVEFFFYALFPLLFNRIYAKTELKKLFIPIISFWAVSQIILNILGNSSFYKGFPSNSHDLLYYNPIMHLNEFLIGNLAGLFFLKMDKTKSKNYTWHLLVLLILLILLLKLPIPVTFHDGLLAIIFIPFILFFSLSSGTLAKIFNSKALIFLGEISYGIYILQIPVYYWSMGLLRYLGFHNNYVLFYFPLIILIASSSLSYVYIETPLRKMIKNIGASEKSKYYNSDPNK